MTRKATTTKKATARPKKTPARSKKPEITVLTVIQQAPCENCVLLNLTAQTTGDTTFTLHEHIICAHQIAVANANISNRLERVAAEMEAATAEQAGNPAPADNPPTAPAQPRDPSYG